MPSEVAAQRTRLLPDTHTIERGGSVFLNRAGAPPRPQALSSHLRGSRLLLCWDRPGSSCQFDPDSGLKTFLEIWEARAGKHLVTARVYGASTGMYERTERRPTISGGRRKSPAKARVDHRNNEEAALVRRVQAKDEMAFREIVERYQAKVFSIIYGILRNHNDAEDIAQQVFSKVYFSIRN